jgi:hypothetical protein
MTLFRSKAEDKVRAAGYDPARLPPGQYLTEKWPVLHAGQVPKVDLATWDLRVFGEVDNEITLTYDELKALPATEVTSDIHCVTRWSRFDAHFKGVHWREQASGARQPEGERALRHRARGARLHRQLALVCDRGRQRADRVRGGRRAADAGPRLARAPVRTDEVLLEEREMAARPRARGGRPARLLGALRLPQQCGLLERGALQLLDVLTTEV